MTEFVLNNGSQRYFLGKQLLVFRRKKEGGLCFCLWIGHFYVKLVHLEFLLCLYTGTFIKLPF